MTDSCAPLKLTLSFLGFLASIGTAIAAELPDIVKTQAGQFEAAMKQYDASVAAQKKMALDQYVAFLTGARKMEEGAKRPAGVTRSSYRPLPRARIDGCDAFSPRPRPSS